ncbi:endopeptidase La [uncultured Anaerococcus sp.]|uniref:endopeptidase La n=1 Tax=uncultured Anaerococcus sp. TaxID=293428 RepID=UPI002635336C|nr:endopeptidase La [uncultured Anaerococcus sp.]
MADVYNLSTNEYPLVPLRGLWAFPNTILNFDCSRPISKKAIEDANIRNTDIFLVNQKNIFDENPHTDAFYEYGMLVGIKESFNLPNGDLRVYVEAKAVAKIKEINIGEGFYRAVVEEYNYIEENEEQTPKKEALRKLLLEDFKNYVELDGNVYDESVFSIGEVHNLHRLADIIIYHLDLKADDYYALLKELDTEARLTLLHEILSKEIELKNLSLEIDQEVQDNINQSQKEYFLREKIGVIQRELNETTGDFENEALELIDKIEKLNIDEDSKKSLLKDARRLEAIPEMSPDYGVISSYLDFVVNLPWDEKSEDKLDIKRAEKILDEDHYGLDEVKERVLESIAVRIKNKNNQGTVLCLVGPPGVGKTSIAKSIARSLDRKFVTMRLGGVTDESEIRGHRRTYVGAMAGRVMTNINRSEIKNPVFLLDEVDKLGSDFRGDPSSALLEVLDPEQNDKFIDRYLDIPFDLSDVFFITTANDAGEIPDALYDRLEMIELSGYTASEKLNIAKRYLVEKEMEKNGLKEGELTISDAVLEVIIKNYTREAGVRELERLIAKICRRAVKEILEGKDQVRVTMANYSKYLGKERFFEDHISKEDKVGVVNGLAWTAVGGTMLTIEANVMEGKGNVEFTGSLGDVMKESGQAAMTYIRSNAKKLDIKGKFYEDKDIHVHIPEGATPKDGPSAGITMTTAMVSALTDRKARNDIAMTGEVTITGDVLPIGGLKEKALAAYTYGIRDVIIPTKNKRDIEDIPKEIRDKINFIEVSNVSEVIDRALI